MDWVILYLVFGSIMVLGFLGFVGAIGIVCAPFAAYLTYRRARQHGFDPVRYAFIGALYSTLILLPWFLLLGKLNGRYPSTGWALSTLYFSWLFGPITFVFSTIDILEHTNPPLMFTAGCLMIIAWGGSLIWLRILKKRNNQPVYYPMSLREKLLALRRKQREGQLPEHGYIVPFVCAAFSLLAALGLMVFIG